MSLVLGFACDCCCAPKSRKNKNKPKSKILSRRKTADEENPEPVNIGDENRDTDTTSSSSASVKSRELNTGDVRTYVYEAPEGNRNGVRHAEDGRSGDFVVDIDKNAVDLGVRESLNAETEAKGRLANLSNVHRKSLLKPIREVV